MEHSLKGLVVHDIKVEEISDDMYECRHLVNGVVAESVTVKGRHNVTDVCRKFLKPAPKKKSKRKS